MTGLDKIVSQILEDADKEASALMEKARAEATEIIKGGEEESRRLKEDGEKKRVVQADSYMDRIRSSADLKKRQSVLLAKQQVIAGMLDKAYETLLKKEPEEYFAMILRMLEKSVLAKQGEIYFSRKDLDRMPSGFEAELENAAASKGGGLKLIKEPKIIDGGFILVYGGIEENCSFKALISSRKDELSDQAHELLFL